MQITQFDDLDFVKGELNLKKLLWTSLTEWDDLSHEWHERRLDELDADVMNAEVYWCMYLSKMHVKNTKKRMKCLFLYWNFIKPYLDRFNCSFLCF